MNTPPGFTPDNIPESPVPRFLRELEAEGITEPNCPLAGGPVPDPAEPDPAEPAPVHPQADADLTQALDGRNGNAVMASWNRLALVRSIMLNTEHDLRTLADTAAGLPALARLSPAEAEALADVVSYAHVLRGRLKLHLPAISGATFREGDLAQAMAKQGKI